MSQKKARLARKAANPSGYYKAPKTPTPLLARSLNSRQVSAASVDLQRELAARARARLNLKES